MSEMISNISSFNTNCLLPFVEDFFSSNLGITFVGSVVIVVVLRGLATLFKTKF